MKKSVQQLVGLATLLFSSTVMAATTDISSLTLATFNSVQPNLMFLLDDSDSVDNELIMNYNNILTYGGALFWNGSTKKFVDASGNLISPASHAPGITSGVPWFQYIYLFPNGSSNVYAPTPIKKGSRRTPDDFYTYYGYFAVPPLPEYGWVRDYEYNPLYYNPNVTYTPWPNAYISNGVAGYSQGDVSFGDAPIHAALSDPTIPLSPTMDMAPTPAILATLPSPLTNIAKNTTFRMLPGMTIPANVNILGTDYANIQKRTVSTGGAYGTWGANVGSFTIPAGGTTAYDVNIPYYPATYYLKDATCTTGLPDCATGPDGAALRKYEITDPTKLQNFANWFTYYRKRRYMIAGAMGQILPTTSNIRAGVVTMNQISTLLNGSTIRTYTPTLSVYDLNNTTSSTSANAILGVFDTNQSVTAANPNAPAAATYDLNYIGQQYMANNTSTPSRNLIQYACQMNAAMYVTDGYPDAPPVVPVVTLGAYSKAVWGGTSPYSTTYNNTLADVALYYYSNRLRPDLTAGEVPVNTASTAVNADTNTNLHMNTFAFSLTQQGTIFGTGTPAALDPFTTAPVWPLASAYTGGAPATLDDMWHATLNGRGTIYSGNSLSSTISSFQSIVGDFLQQTAAASAVGVANPNITSTNNSAYAASYLGNTGNLLPYTIDPITGEISEAGTWDAQALLDAKASTSRIIATYDGAAGLPFRWASLPSTMQTRLNSAVTPPGPSDGSNVLNWLRGDRTLERITYRIRAHVLGDLVDASPVVIGQPTVHYADAGYSSFYTSLASRPTMIYQGGNDGMLHAFNASTGSEIWAYIPKLVFNNLRNLAAKTYNHQFYVDATPTVGDVGVSGSTWRTLLVGGLNAGGNGYYAIDVTDPTAITSEATLATKVLWEFPNTSTATSVANNVGLSFGKPIICKTAANGWVVIVSSGYNNTSGDGLGHLFILNANTGALIRDIPTSSGSPASPSGLGQISAFAKHWNYDATIDYVYGGDLNGNVWRFDLTGTSTAAWNVSKLATLVDSSGVAQPITTTPQLTTVNNNRMVFVGTGKLLGVTDLSATQTQTMYALIDNLSSSPTIPAVRSSLYQKTYASGTISNAAVDFSVYRGWYFDLVSPGERIVSDPTLAFGALVFDTNLPSTNLCRASSYEYAVDSSNGGVLPAADFVDGVPWVRTSLSATFVTKPLLVILANHRVQSIVHDNHNEFTVMSVPSNITNPTVRKVGWKDLRLK